MTFPAASDDLTPALVTPAQEFVGFSQGIIRAWNPTTFENTVSVRGADLHDLPVKSGVDALAYQVGNVVMLSKWRPSGGGMSQYWIDGRAVLPGAGRAEEAIGFMSSSLGRAVAASVFADRIAADAEPGQVTAVDTGGYQDLGGPEVEIDIGPSGIALVFISALIAGDNTSSSPGFHANVGGRMSFEVSGATDQPGANDRSVAYTNQVQVSGQTVNVTCAFRQGTSVVASGLNEGLHTFRAIYARLFVGETMTFADRTMIVLGF